MVEEGGEDMERSILFWKFFIKLEGKRLEDGTSNLKSTVLDLIHQKELKRGINCNETDINKVTSHITMRMFTPADLK